jgi:predicted permease
MLVSFREWTNRLRHLIGRRRFDQDLEDEMRFHFEMGVRALEKSGTPQAEAMARARREFARDALARELSREAWRFTWLEDFVADVRHSLRSFRRTPAFALTAVLSLALGIGATSTIYTAVDAVLWKPLPVEKPEQLVNFSVVQQTKEPSHSLPVAFISQLQRAGIFAGVTAEGDDGLSFSYSGSSRAERIMGEVASPNYFEVLGIKPFLGQGFSAKVRSGKWAPEAVLSYSFWKRRFGGDPKVLGHTIYLNTYPFEIVGVSSPSILGMERGVDEQLCVSILPQGRELAQIDLISGDPQQELGPVARLKAGSTLGQAQGALDAQFEEFLRTTTDQRFRDSGVKAVHLVPGAWGLDNYMDALRTPLVVLMILAGIVLVTACFNVANMLLARGAARAGEFALRASLGAGRLRLARQLLAESILLSLAGGALGVVLANWTAGALFGFLPQSNVRLAIDLHVDWRALVFTFSIALLTGILFGLLPAFQATSGSTASVLKSDTPASTEGRHARFRKVLVMAQVAFSLALLIAAGVFVETVSKLRPSGYSVNPARVLLFTMKPQQEIYSDQRKLQISTELVQRISDLPGVASAALAENGPLGARWDNRAVARPGREPIDAGGDAVSPGFFDTVGIRRISGRDFNAQDKLGAPLVAIVNESLARLLYPNEEPVGQALNIQVEKQNQTYRIIGVVADTRYYDVHKPEEPFVWISMWQNAPYMPTLFVQSKLANNAGMTARVLAQFNAVDKGFPVFDIKTMADRIEDSLAGERMVANLSGGFGIVALMLAAVGLYGILAYSVSRRTREIGIRMALGARPGSVLWMVVREAFVLVGFGSAAGLLMALATFRAISHYLQGVAPLQPVVAVACVFGMLLTALCALAVPALRACRIDPLRALRHE